MEHMLYAKGISWIDDCRIPFVDDIWIAPKKPRSNLGIKLSKGNEERNEANIQGRFPANILVCDDMLNDGVISKTNTEGQIRSEKRNIFVLGQQKTRMNKIQDKGTNSRYYDIDKWFDNLLESCE